MADHLYCLVDPANPGLIRIASEKYDPRMPPGCGRRRELAEPGSAIRWCLRVCDGDAAEAALKQALEPYRRGNCGESFWCEPMTARGEAIRFITLRGKARKPETMSRQRGWLSSFLRGRNRDAA